MDEWACGTAGTWPCSVTLERRQLCHAAKESLGGSLEKGKGRRSAGRERTDGWMDGWIVGEGSVGLDGWMDGWEGRARVTLSNRGAP